ncbi:hypothetical protein ACPC54_03925 [Kitasatospora sp. NPDC094028]
MRTSVITRFAKNDRSFSARRSLAALATTVVLAGGVQLLTATDASACSGPDTDGNVPAVSQETLQDRDFDLHGAGAKASFFDVPETLTVGGAKAEFGVQIANFSKADYHKVAAGFGLFNPHGATPRPSQVTVEVMDHGHWKRLTMKGGCDPAIHAVGMEALGEPLAVGRARRYMFRVSISADAPKDMNELQVYGGDFASATTTVKVVRQAPAAEPAAPAKPKATKKPAKPAPAEPAADTTQAPAKAAEPAKAPAATPTAAPATTAPAGTPELAHTGAAENNTFLAVSSALFLALGSGVLIAVRRMRPQRDSG